MNTVLNLKPLKRRKDWTLIFFTLPIIFGFYIIVRLEIIILPIINSHSSN